MNRIAPWWLSCALGVLPAQDPALLDAHRITSGEFATAQFGPAVWLDGAHYATLEPDGKKTALEVIRYEAVSGAREVLLSVDKLVVAGRDAPLQIESYALSPDGTKALVFTDSGRVWRANTRGEYFVIDVAGKNAPKRLGGDLPKSSLMFAKWSPSGDRVAYVSGNDLWVENVADGVRTRLTKDGSKTIINGTFDWVYEEEFDCRDGFRWSPDGNSIAYWQLDCSGVGEFYMVDNLSDRYSKVVPVQYPKAGTTNSSCKVGVVAANGGETVWMQTPGDPRETYLARMEWHPGGKELMVQWLPRRQNVLQVLGCDVATGKTRLVHEEKDEAYVDVRDDFAWIGKGEWFFWTSDTAFAEPGEQRWRQAGKIYWDTRGKQMLVTQIALTRGFDVLSVLHFDAAQNLLLVTASPLLARAQYLYKVENGEPKQVGQFPRPSTFFVDMVGESYVVRGWNEYEISPDGALALHTASSFDVPPFIDLVRLPSHECVRTLVDNARVCERYAAVTKGKTEFFDIPIGAGNNVWLDGWVMYPADFDAQKSWPVVFHVYGEPWSQTVKDTWFLSHHLFHRWLTQQGYVVMSLDARGTPAPKGRDWRKALYQKIGVTSSHDWNLAVQKLCKSHAWMDRSRLAIWGWSGGGAMTLNMLFRYPDLFCAGMSVAPVTDVSLYDTIYQERYLGDPREFPDVYRECSPITFAKNLKGKLLLVHGTGDDNVHFQHSERLFDELVAHGKQFEYLAYPNRTHAIREGRNTREHLYAALSDFLHRRVPAGPK